MEKGERDIIVENRYGLLQRIDELHPLYLPMQYLLLFSYGEDRYREETLYRHGSISDERKQRHLTLRQYFAYKIQDRHHEFNMILRDGKVTQQFIVDGFTMIEAQRTTFFQFHQKNLCTKNYVTLTNALSKGRYLRQLLVRQFYPSSFTRSKRYSRENFQDAMAICTATGFPDLFITFTCNPRWPELDKLFEALSCKPKDRPDLVSRIFKIKPNMLIKDITKDMLFGRCSVGILVSRLSRMGFELDNRFVVPYNMALLLRYQTHINIKFCKQSRSIKYLFKCVCKGHNKITVALCNENTASERNPLLSDSLSTFQTKSVVFCDEDAIDDVVEKATLNHKKFLAWFEAKKIHPIARDLTYAQFTT
ncbi:uncharacterized protein G2W53_041007 [Senna tora]|uniref:Helitron helicase-like domain-containing protein n=1 Tax=Senna tora TaxID=362788 RepID=A0A834SF16_9FABA|nr:uncharacterized protein G2W53_041007 [Senna tora]